MISSTTYNNSYAKTLSAKAAALALDEPSDEWLHFLLDHRTYLKNHEDTILVPLTEADLYRYRYRLNDYLAENSSSRSLVLAVRVMNKIGCDQDFDLSCTQLYIPSLAAVRELRDRYITIRAKLKKLNI
jgi:hypothetical protein